MDIMAKFKSDEIGPWSEIKLEIIEKYAAAYTKILSNATVKLKYELIDGFSGAGEHISKSTKKPIEGSPVRALKVVPPLTGQTLSANAIPEITARSAERSAREAGALRS